MATPISRSDPPPLPPKSEEERVRSAIRTAKDQIESENSQAALDTIRGVRELVAFIPTALAEELSQVLESMRKPLNNDDSSVSGSESDSSYSFDEEDSQYIDWSVLRLTYIALHAALYYLDDLADQTFPQNFLGVNREHLIACLRVANLIDEIKEATAKPQAINDAIKDLDKRLDAVEEPKEEDFESPIVTRTEELFEKASNAIFMQLMAEARKQCDAKMYERAVATFKTGCNFFDPSKQELIQEKASVFELLSRVVAAMDQEPEIPPMEKCVEDLLDAFEKLQIFVKDNKNPSYSFELDGTETAFDYNEYYDLVQGVKAKQNDHYRIVKGKVKPRRKETMHRHITAKVNAGMLLSWHKKAIKIALKKKLEEITALLSHVQSHLPSLSAGKETIQARRLLVDGKAFLDWAIAMKTSETNLPAPKITYHDPIEVQKSTPKEGYFRRLYMDPIRFILWIFTYIKNLFRYRK